MASADGAASADRLRALVAGPTPEIDIAEAALALSALARPGLELAPYRAHLAQLADEANAGGDGSPPAALAAILAGDHGYRGDRKTYDDLANADLARVIDRRRGLPVALSILWMHTARARGWRCRGLDAPGHFVVRLEAEDGAWILDPFDGGTVLEPEALEDILRRFRGPPGRIAARDLAVMDDRGVLLRLQKNIRLRLQQVGDGARALQVLERMLVVSPRAGELWREAAVLNAGLGNLGAAIACLDRAIALAGTDEARERIGAERARLAGRLN
jgi:regulator of sirC expression with transglutaminase-like and TPR domain